MLNAIFRSIFGTKHERDVKRMRPVVARCRARAGLQALSDEALRNRTTELRQRLAAGPSSTTCSRTSARSARRRPDRAHASLRRPKMMAACYSLRQDRGDGTGEARPGGHAPAYLNASRPGTTWSRSTTTWPRRDAQWMGPIYHAPASRWGDQHEMQTLRSVLRLLHRQYQTNRT